MDIAKELRNGAQIMGLSLSSEQEHKLLQYMQLLQRWNKTYNLTALKSDEQMLVHHLLDSLAVVLPLWAKFSAEQSIRVLDVGSGGGLPGVVLAILNPNWQISCVDAVQKKTSFIQLSAGILNLKNLKSIHTRVEKLVEKPFEIVISRAFASLADFANLAGRQVAPSGYLVAMKGHQIEAEVEQLVAQSDWQLASVESLTVPRLDAQRCVMWLEPKSSQTLR